MISQQKYKEAKQLTLKQMMASDEHSPPRHMLNVEKSKVLNDTYA